MNQEDYVISLEKINQQISLSWNPLYVIVAILTALFAVFTIIFGVVIFLQSREYKQGLSKRRNEFQEEIEKLFKSIAERNEKTFNSWISNKQEEFDKLKKSKISKTKIEEIEKLIKDLKIEKEILKSPITIKPNYTNLASGGVSTYAFSNERLHKCSHCGYSFMIENHNHLGIADICIAPLGGGSVCCPKCGNIDSI